MGDKPCMAAILLAFASAAFLGTGVCLRNSGSRPSTRCRARRSASRLHAVLPAAVADPAAWRHDRWRAVPIFAAVGLVFPVVLTLMTFASNRALGPVVTSALGNLSPLFAVALAVMVLHEPMRVWQLIGPGRLSGRRADPDRHATADMRDWRLALLLPLGAALLRGIIPPVIKVGLEIWPNPIGAGLTGYIVSSLTVLTIERIRTGHFIVQGPLSGRCGLLSMAWSTASARCCSMPRSAPDRSRWWRRSCVLSAGDVGLSALVLSNVRITRGWCSAP